MNRFIIRTLALLWCCLPVGLTSMGANRLTIPDVHTSAGVTVSLPVELDNDDDVVALQFTLTVPDQFTLDVATARMSERGTDHAVKVSPIGGHDYLFVVYSPTNTPLRARKGVVMTVDAQSTQSVTQNTAYPMTMGDAVASDKDMANILTEASAGSFVISYFPDLTPTDVVLSSTTLSPGDRVTLSWNVKNIGRLTTMGGWREQLALVDGQGNTCVLGAAYFNNTLDASGSVSRQADVIIPALPGLGDRVSPRVQVVPNSDCGEGVEVQNNNIATGVQALLAAILNVSLPQGTIAESAGGGLQCQVTRSGLRDEALTVNLQSSDTRVRVPAQAVIDAGKSGGYFNIEIVDNNDIDDTDEVIVTATAAGYPATQSTMTVEDNEQRTLSLTTSRREMTEGESLTLTVTTDRALSRDAVITLGCNLSALFDYSQSVTLLAGETSVDVEVTAKDDNVPNVDQEVVFTAVGERFIGDEAYVTLHDNDIPDFVFTLTPTTVSESAGPNAMAAKLRRLNHTDNRITFVLSDDSNGGLSYQQQRITMEAGIDEVQFMIGVVSNNVVDGDRNINVTAAIYIQSCSCSAGTGQAGSVTQQVTVIDDDGPALTLQSPRSTVVEGGEATLTIGRNANFDQALTVTLSSDHDSGLNYPAVVTIPAGAASVEVAVSAPKNEISNDDRIVALEAAAVGFAKGTCWIMISDQTLPDAVIDDLRLSADECETQAQVVVEASVANRGAAPLPAQTKVELYWESGNTMAAALYTQSELAPGESVTLSKSVSAPVTTGSHTLQAIVNKEKKVKELLYTNNNSAKLTLAVTSPFTATLAVNKDAYGRGERVRFDGQLTGNGTANREVEIYLLSNGLRQTIGATTDAGGHFEAEYTPFDAQVGHFVAGACYPGEKLSTPMVQFDILGLQLVETQALTNYLIVNEPYTASFHIKNPTAQALTVVSAGVASKPEACDIVVDGIDRLEGGATAEVSFTITTTAVTPTNNWQTINLELASAEGATVPVTLYYYSTHHKALLQPDVTRIKTTITKGQSREYPIHVQNMGKGATGNITVSLPDWMQLATPSVIPSIEQGETATIVLRLTATGNMQLNVPVTGTIGINCENGDGITIPYSVEPVSESTGKLIVDVCDEYTYYTAEKPHVAGAKVSLRHPTTGAIIAEGETNEAGVFEVTVPEGYYALRVTAERHDTYSNNILVDPGVDTKKVVNLSFKAITIDYDVRETEVEDRYDIVTTVKYETNVPKPIVVMDGPSRIDGDAMQAGESVLIYITLTNKGMVNADDVTFHVPESNEEWQMVALDYTEPFVLGPQQNVTIPVMVTRLSVANNLPTHGPKKVSKSYFYDCMAKLATDYYNACGTELKDNQAALLMSMKFCGTTTLTNVIADLVTDLAMSMPYVPGGGKPVNPPSGGGTTSSASGNDPGSGGMVSIDRDKTICNPCVAEKGSNLLDFFISQYEGVGGAMLGKFNQSLNDFLGGIIKKVKFKSLVSDIQDMKDLYDKLRDLEDFHDAISMDCSKSSAKSRKGAPQASGIDWLDSYVADASDWLDQVDIFKSFSLEIAGDPVWYEEYDDSMKTFWEQVEQREGTILLLDDFIPYKPDGVSIEQLQNMLTRLNNTTFNNTGSDNRIIRANIVALYEQFISYDQQAQQRGFETQTDLVIDSYNRYVKRYRDESSSVCSSITLQFKQQMTMTRQAFEGTLLVYNGHESESMRDVTMVVTVTNEDGIPATAHEFQIHPTSKDGFAGDLDLQSGWTLGAGENGKVIVQYIPTKYAAPQTEQVYTFGGSLTYLDPFTGMSVTREFAPQRLTVKPCPELELTYFMQRDIIGDDPLTPQVEARQPAEFALIINNKGYGDATNVAMLTHQPQIIDNEKGLLNTFKLVGSQLNGGEKSLAMGQSEATQFGDIPARSQAYAQWWIESDLLGHFIDYDVQVNHVTSYGNEDLSLVDRATIKELVHGFTVPSTRTNAAGTPRKALPDGVALRGFLVNELPDADDQPDEVYFADATQEHALTNSTATVERIDDTQYRLSVTPSIAGWNYGKTGDPGRGKMKLSKIVRESDGVELPIDNMWLTDRTLRDALEPIYENLLHYVVELTDAEESYLLTFEPIPDLELQVEQIAGTPEDGKTFVGQVQQLTVVFNKDIDPATFTTDDLEMMFQGQPVDVSAIGIERIDSKTFTLDVNQLTAQDGYYVLTVKTLDINDAEGYSGQVGRQASWTQLINGFVQLSVDVYPANSGNVSPGSQEVEYGQSVRLTATAEDGYHFVNWAIGNEVVGESEVMEYVLTEDTPITAVFAQDNHSLTIDYDEDLGSVEIEVDGNRYVISSGLAPIYAYGTTVRLTALPNAESYLKSWAINEAEVGNAESLTVVVNQDTRVTANFKDAHEHSSIDELPAVAGNRLDVVLSPVPVKSSMTVRGNFDRIKHLQVFDVAGNLKLSISDKAVGHVVPMHYLAGGVYVVMIETEKGSLAATVIKE